MAEFKPAIDYVIGNEGDFSNDGDDHGGATRFGITMETLSRWEQRTVSVEEVRKLSREEAEEIYLKWWWFPLGCDKVADQRIATAILDVGVNDGAPTSTRFAQQAAGVKVDGHIGDNTEKAINAIDFRVFLAHFIPLVQNHYWGICLRDHTQEKFFQGWLTRSQKLIGLMV